MTQKFIEVRKDFWIMMKWKSLKFYNDVDPFGEE